MPFGEENIISLPLFFCHTKCYTRHNESPQFCPVFHAFGSPAKPRLKGNMYMENEYIIEMLNITKEFPGIKANDNITLQLKKGEIHALLGENGAGKSTLMSILFGLYQPTSGIIKKNGQEVHINTPNDANDLNIGMVHQHFKPVSYTHLDVYKRQFQDSVRLAWTHCKMHKFHSAHMFISLIY